MRTNIGKALAKVRIDAGLTQYDMADAIGVTNAFLSSVAGGKRRLSFSRARQLAEYIETLGLDSSEFQTAFIAEGLTRIMGGTDEQLVAKFATAIQRETAWHKAVSNLTTTEECKQNEPT